MLNKIIGGTVFVGMLLASIALNLADQRKIGVLQSQVKTITRGYEYAAIEREALDKAYTDKTREVNRVSSTLSKQISALKALIGTACDDAPASDERISILRQPVVLPGE